MNIQISELLQHKNLLYQLDEKVYFNLIAADVKHSFWIPAVGGKLDTNVENVNKFYLTFEEESRDVKDGVFYGKCAELCGPSHALMDFKVKTMPRAEFDEWVTSNASNWRSNSRCQLLLSQGEELFAQSCIGCHAVSACW